MLEKGLYEKWAGQNLLLAHGPPTFESGWAGQIIPVHPLQPWVGQTDYTRAFFLC